MLPSPGELTCFFEVANCLNFSRASERLGVSQPSVSLAIKRLEQSISTPLFVRHKQGVTLTQAGDHLLSQVKPLLSHWENTKRQAKSAHEEVRGKVTIGCRSAAAHHLNKFILCVLELYPELEINLKFQSSLQTTESVINSSIDIGIVNNPLNHHDLVIHQMDCTRMSFWVGHGDREIQDIHSGKAVILCEPELPIAQMLLRKLEKSNIPIGRLLTANSLEVIAHLTATGCGIGILPSCFAAHQHPGKLRLIEELPFCEYQVCLIYRYENKHVRAVSTVLSMLKSFDL